MQADLSHFIIEDKQNLGWRFHWLRAEQQEPIDICAQKLNVSVDVKADNLTILKSIWTS